MKVMGHCMARDQEAEARAFGVAHVPLLENHLLHGLGFCPLIQTGDGPLGLAVAESPMMVGPLGQRVRTSHRWPARWTTVGRRLTVAVAVLAVAEVVAAELGLLKWPSALVNRRALFVNLPPVVEEQRCEQHSHRWGLGV